MGTMTRDEAVAALTKPGSPFEIVDTQVGDISTRVYATAPPSLVSILESSRAHGDRDFLVYEHDRYTFSDHHGIVAALATWLAREHGITKGDRVGDRHAQLPRVALRLLGDPGARRGGGPIERLVDRTGAPLRPGRQRRHLRRARRRTIRTTRRRPPRAARAVDRRPPPRCRSGRCDPLGRPAR